MIIKCYYKLENKLLPYFLMNSLLKSAGGRVFFPIRNPQNQMPKIKHEYAKQFL